MSKIYAIGDIHGQADMLAKAMCELLSRLEDGDTVIFLGDYIDRGPDSRGVITLLRAMRSEWKDTIFLRGNHDQMLLEAFAYPADRVDIWLANGGHETLASYNSRYDVDGDWRELIPKGDLDFLLDTKIEHKQALWHFVHAGLPESDDLTEEQAAWVKMWIREGFLESERDYGAIVVFGHTIQHSGTPLIMANKIGIDTGAFVPGGCLTCLVLDKNQPFRLQYFQVTQSLAVHDFDFDISNPREPVPA